MITKEQLFELFENCYNQIVGDRVDYTPREYHDRELDSILMGDEMSELQWQTLVETCQVIVDNSERFDMAHYHDRTKTCGTSHCIGAWAVAVVLNDPDITYIGGRDLESVREKYNFNQFRYVSGAAQHACAFISPLVFPFFYLTGDDEGRDNFKCTTEQANQIIMNEFILPVLEIAKQENV